VHKIIKRAREEKAFTFIEVGNGRDRSYFIKGFSCKIWLPGERVSHMVDLLRIFQVKKEMEDNSGKLN